MRLAREMILVGACGLVIGGVACRSQVPNPVGRVMRKTELCDPQVHAQT